MPQQWFFTTDEDGIVNLRSRGEGEGGIVAHAYGTVGPGEQFHGVSYEELLDAVYGIVEIDDDGNGELLDEDEEA